MKRSNKILGVIFAGLLYCSGAIHSMENKDDGESLRLLGEQDLNALSKDEIEKVHEVTKRLKLNGKSDEQINLLSGVSRGLLLKDNGNELLKALEAGIDKNNIGKLSDQQRKAIGHALAVAHNVKNRRENGYNDNLIVEASKKGFFKEPNAQDVSDDDKNKIFGLWDSIQEVLKDRKEVSQRAIKNLKELDDAEQKKPVAERKKNDAVLNKLGGEKQEDDVEAEKKYADKLEFLGRFSDINREEIEKQNQEITILREECNKRIDNEIGRLSAEMRSAINYLDDAIGRKDNVIQQLEQNQKVANNHIRTLLQDIGKIKEVIEGQVIRRQEEPEENYYHNFIASDRRKEGSQTQYPEVQQDVKLESEIQNPLPLVDSIGLTPQNQQLQPEEITQIIESDDETDQQQQSQKPQSKEPQLEKRSVNSRFGIQKPTDKSQQQQSQQRQPEEPQSGKRSVSSMFGIQKTTGKSQQQQSQQRQPEEPQSGKRSVSSMFEIQKTTGKSQQQQQSKELQSKGLQSEKRPVSSMFEIQKTTGKSQQ
jgi:hypothetical protein